MRALVIAPALCLAGLPGHAQQQSSSQQASSDQIAEAARKAREEKKNAEKPKKVYTEDDVKPGSASSPDNSAGAAPATSAAARQAAGGASPAEDPNGEKAWRKKFQEHREKIAKAERELDVLQREAQKAQVEYYPDPQKALSEQNSRKEIGEKFSKIDAKKKELEQLKLGLNDLEDQLRKSGGDPGWAR